MALNQDCEVRLAVAENINTSLEALEKMAKDKNDKYSHLGEIPFLILNDAVD